MNSGTLVGSLIFAGIVVIAIAVVIQLMMLGWRRRGERQQELIGTLPTVPDVVGGALGVSRGLYVGSTLAPAWNERVTAGDLGYRSKAVLTRYPEGILMERIRAQPIWIPQESITAIRTERGSPARSPPATASWRSGGGCPRVSRSTPGSARTTAANTSGWTASRRVA